MAGMVEGLRRLRAALTCTLRQNRHVNAKREEQSLFPTEPSDR